MAMNQGLPADRPADPDHPLRWGVVGTGSIAHTVMSDLLLLPDAVLAGVCSRSADRGAAFAAALDIGPGRRGPVVYESLTEMLPEIDVLYVATPHAVHHETAIPALESRTAVLVEKALTVHLDRAQAMVDASRRSSTFLMEAIWTRFNPLHVQLRELIAAGALGEIRSVTDDFSFRFPFDPAHRLFDPALGGGSLLDLGPYPVSLIQSLLGDPDAVDVAGSLAPNGMDDGATLLFRYPDGVTGIGSCSMRAEGPNTATVVGTRGRVEMEANALRPTRMTLHREGHDPQVFTTEIEGSGYLPQLREVQARVRAGEIESAVMPHRDSLSIMRILTGALTDLGVRHP